MTSGSQPAPPQPAGTPARRSRRWWWLLAVPVVVLIALLGGTVTWLLYSEGAVPRAVALANRYLPAPVGIEGASGSLARGLRIAMLDIPVGSTRVRIHELRVTIADWSWWRRAVDFDELAATEVLVRLGPPQPAAAPAPPPQRLALPWNLHVRRLAVARIVVAREQPVVSIDDVQGEVAIGRDGASVRMLALRVGDIRATLAGTVGGAAPFPIDAGGTVQSRLQIGDQPVTTPVQAVWRALDSLQDLQLNAGITGGPDQRARGAVRLRLAPFTAAPLRTISVDVEGFDPRAWFAGAPEALLAVRADLAPVAGDTLTLAGPIEADNTQPRAWDQRGLPVRSVRAQLQASRERVELSEAQIELLRGTARARFAIDPRTPQRWTLAAQLAGVDPAALHTRAQPWRVDGRVDVEQRGATTAVRADVRGVDPRNRWPATLQAQADIDAQRIAVSRGVLRVGDGSVELRGELGQAAPQRFAFTGSARAFDPGRLVRGLDGRLNAELAVEGNVQPTPQGTLRAQFDDSVLVGRPLRGRVVAGWRGDGVLDLDADLAVRSAQLTARGSLAGTAADARAEQAIRIELRAPALGDLGVPLRGAGTAEATVRGSWQAPAVQAQFALRDLALGEQRIAELGGRLGYGGGVDGAVEAQLELRGHRHPADARLSLQRLTATLDGRLGEHRLVLDGRLADGAAVRAEARGGVDRAAAAWRGSLAQFELGGAFATRLRGAAPLEIAAASGGFGPAQLQVHGARVDVDRTTWRDSGLQTAGRVSEWRVALDNGGAAAAAEPPLQLRAEWALRTGARLDGRLLIERVGGDVYGGGAGRRVAMGLTELRLLAVARDRALDVSMVAAGSNAGSVRAQLAAQLEGAGNAWRVAQDRPVAGSVRADIPTLEWVDRLLSANLRENVRIGGAARARLQVSGTPRRPQFAGPIEADALRVAWVEQGLRMENGRVRARLSTDGDGSTVLHLDEAAFAGTPRLRPRDRRIEAAIPADHTGTLRANGSVKLPSLEGVVQVSMDKFPLLQRPDRWLVATGGANIVVAPQRVQLNGAAVADAGFIDVSRRDAPTLSNDVVVQRPAEERGDKPAAAPARTAFDFDVTADLGPAFLLRGSGIDARLAGALRVQHAGRGVVRATGTLTARDGTYEGYGQKLVIRRGRVLFQGPVENPGLDILALRSGLPVDVGISIGRTAQNPLVRLYSDPAMSDYETLSWLVLGRQPEDAGNDNAALASAALGLLGGSGEGIPTTLARRLGIDEFSIRSGTSTTGASLLPRQAVAGRLRPDGNTLTSDIVTIGKRLSDDLTLSYEQVVGGSGGIAQLAYRLSRRFSVIARAGTENALELVYTYSFD